MKKLIFGFIILLIAVGLGFLIHKDPGYLLISYANWRIETSLWVAVIAIILTFLILYFLIRLIHQTTTLSHKFKRWSQLRNERKARTMTNQGLCELAEGNWQHAETKLSKAATNSNTPLINYLAAARAAQEQAAYDRRDDYLRKAHETTTGTALAVGLTQAQLQINSKQWEQALATLKHLNQITPHHKYVLKLLKRTYLELQDWSQLLMLLPALTKYKVLSTSELNHLEEKVYLALLKNAARSSDNQALETIWDKIPKNWKSHPPIVTIYTGTLIERNQDATAIIVIEQALKKNWDPSLVKNYGLATSDNNAKQLSNAEGWLKKHPKEAELLLTLGQLSMRGKFWGKAREYLEESIAIAPRPETYQTLGQLLETLGDQNAALEHYRKGLSLSSETPINN